MRSAALPVSAADGIVPGNGLQDILQRVFGQIGSRGGLDPSSSGVQVFMSSMRGAMGGGGGVGGVFGRIPRTFGDYAVGNIDSILNELLQSDSGNRKRPASKKFIADLKEIPITGDQCASGLDCAVCKDTFKKNDGAYRLPCGHYYHPDCILPWIKTSNTCPTCRFALPKEGEDGGLSSGSAMDVDEREGSAASSRPSQSDDDNDDDDENDDDNTGDEDDEDMPDLLVVSSSGEEDDDEMLD